jgi:hypothetical protein
MTVGIGFYLATSLLAFVFVLVFLRGAGRDFRLEPMVESETTARSSVPSPVGSCAGRPPALPAPPLAGGGHPR